VNISSIGGKMWEPLGSWYHATKFAVEGLSDSLRAEVSPFGIKVVVIEPGAIRAEWGAISADNLEASSAGTVYRDQAKIVSGRCAPPTSPGSPPGRRSSPRPSARPSSFAGLGRVTPSAAGRAASCSRSGCSPIAASTGSSGSLTASSANAAAG
jgi:NAD(P)-dependent dehydrogenase (short-subunit alcohol dehydrogenase family)